MKGLFFILAFCFFTSCVNVSKNNESDLSKFEKYIPDTTNDVWNKVEIILKNNITNELNLKSIENGVDSIEIRLWTRVEASNGIDIYIVRKNKYQWDCYHYWIIETNVEFENPQKTSFTELDYAKVKVDSFWVTQEYPRSGWNSFIAQIINSEIFNLISQNEIPNWQNLVDDGLTYMIEIATKNKYRVYWYNCPDIYSNSIECQNMCEILELFNQEFDLRNSMVGTHKCRN